MLSGKNCYNFGLNTHRLVQTIRPDFVTALLGVIPGALLLLVVVAALAVFAPDYKIIGVVLLAVWTLYKAARIWLGCLSAKYQVFEDVVVSSIGIISRNSTQVRIADIRGMSVRQSLLGRLIGIGDVTIGTAATGDAEIVMRGVRNPAGIVSAIDGLR